MMDVYSCFKIKFPMQKKIERANLRIEKAPLPVKEPTPINETPEGSREVEPISVKKPKKEKKRGKKEGGEEGEEEVSSIHA
jgi:hypothetical protein